jgi:hypothetical protein
MEAVLDEAIELSDHGKTSLKDLLEAWGDRSYGPLFILLGFVSGTPLAIVPGAAGALAVVIAIVAAQMTCGRRHPWTPR